MAEPILNDPTREVGYAIQRTGLLAAGKQLAEAAGSLVEADFVSSLIPVAGILKGYGGVVAIGLTAAVSSGLTEMDYLHRRDNLARLYKEELSVKTGKPMDQVKASDLDTVAKENNTISEELGRSLKQRNFGFGLSFIASMSALAVIRIGLPALAALPAVAAAAPWLGATLAATSVLGIAGAVLLKATVGVAMYNAVKAPLHALADKLFGLDDKTANDYILGIKRAHHAGKAVTREQILSVFVASHPDLSQNIIAQYGKHYDALEPQMQQKVAAEVNTILPLDKMAIDINTNKMNVTELAFAVNGQSSGVDNEHHEIVKKKGLLKELWNGMVDVELPVKIKRKHVTSESSVTYNVADPTHIMALMTNSEPPQEGVMMATAAAFTTRLGLTKKDENLSHVQQLEQASNEPDPGMRLPN